MNERPDRSVLDFWNEQAKLKQFAGTKDLTAKFLEIEAIAGYIHDGMTIMEIGCGNGITAIELASRFKVNIIGVDFAEQMIVEAESIAAERKLKGTVKFFVTDVRDLPSFDTKFDLIYTERVLINLPDWTRQKKAIEDISYLLDEGGVYVMCENSQDGLDKINALRQRIDLPSITPPWHNRYFRDMELEQANIPGLKLEDIVHYSSTYYFLSRVINAWLAEQDGKQPEYDAPINRLALQLPSIGDWGQGKIWLWRRIREA
ncbi:MAG: class I SAM-dependent methyltransferase [Nitrospirae bacterium]|nr:class I SAM-dependent methyltransferase [Nitrospirota bacterium]MCL5976684.1 class I SAM-dependent methyltransferase [Nitrospirota bacterium]